MSLRNTLWLNIAKFMARDGIATTTELARRTGIPQPTLHKFEKGTHRSISLEHIEKLARYFGTDPARLFETNIPELPLQEKPQWLAAMEQLPPDYQRAAAATIATLLQSAGQNTDPATPKKKNA